MITDFPTAPLAPGLTGAGGGTVEKSFYASHTEILTLPQNHINNPGFRRGRSKQIDRAVVQINDNENDRPIDPD